MLKIGMGEREISLQVILDLEIILIDSRTEKLHGVLEKLPWSLNE